MRWQTLFSTHQIPLALNNVQVKTVTQYCAGVKINKNEYGLGRWRVWGGERCAQAFGGET
jgi:hypothetical protein